MVSICIVLVLVLVPVLVRVHVLILLLGLLFLLDRVLVVDLGPVCVLAIVVMVVPICVVVLVLARLRCIVRFIVSRSCVRSCSYAFSLSCSCS